ncbi:MAG: transcription elongation factor NusA-like protein [Candidatus Bathyarchaeota archaeon BA1]|nr:MAG: transcription elongation factor NusA-like protein [Candidatus Bathyarchaeota archaeon BA1]
MPNICHFCLKSGILCPKCQEKVRSGEVSEIDLKVARLLLSLEDTYPPLQEMYFYKAVEANGVLAVIVGRGDVARMLSYSGKIVKALGKDTGKSIRVLEYGVNDRKFLEDLFAPLSIITINTIWLPDGSTETRVILTKRRQRPPPINISALKKIAQRVRGITLRVEFSS